MNCKYKSSMTKKKAFTLIELLIVIAIIGILFIVLVSKVDFATDKAKASGVQTDFRSFQVALETVSKENAGFNTFGWDTGDTKRPDFDTALTGYTYTNATKDAGDRIRNAYDEGDKNLNGVYDDGEVWTGRKVYTETWTGCYTLINPGNASDMSAIFDLETAINKNLDPKLHIVIADDGTISMANGYQDPWSTQYHGQYITNASADAATKWNTDASMAGSTGDNMDRGAILMYSNGANQKFGTKVKIKGGVVTATVSQIDADHLDNNKMGADDYVLAVVYSYTNGYGETAAITEGFSNDQVFLTGNGGGLSVNAYTILNAPSAPISDASEPVSIRSNAPVDDFVEVRFNNNVVDPSNYTVTEGSTVITFKPEFLATLNNGNYTVAIVSKGGTATCNMTIDLPSGPITLTYDQVYDGCFTNGDSIKKDNLFTNIFLAEGEGVYSGSSYTVYGYSLANITPGSTLTLTNAVLCGSFCWDYNNYELSISSWNIVFVKDGVVAIDSELIDVTPEKCDAWNLTSSPIYEITIPEGIDADYIYISCWRAGNEPSGIPILVANAN